MAFLVEQGQMYCDWYCQPLQGCECSSVLQQRMLSPPCVKVVQSGKLLPKSVRVVQDVS